MVPIHAAGEVDGVAFLAMRFIEGYDLRARVRRHGPLSFDRASAVIENAADGLDAIHRGGFVHRDVKPANLLLDPSGHLYVTDFGLAKRAFSRGGATDTGQWVGTLDYVAPEQIRGGRIDARADVYALGGVLHFALTGHVPFERHGDEAKLWAQLSRAAAACVTLAAGDPARGRRGRGPRDGQVTGGPVPARPATWRGPFARRSRGRSPSQPERMVARGGAAPGSAETEPGLALEAPTATARRGPAITPARRRGRWALPRPQSGVLALLAVAALVPALMAREREPGSSRAARAGASPELTTIKGVGRRPTAIVFAAGDLWVASSRALTLTRIEAASGRVRAQHPPVGRGPLSMAGHRNTVWVALGVDRRVVGVDVRTGRVMHRVSVGAKPLRVAADATGLWVLASTPVRRHQLVRYDPSARRIRSRIELPHTATALALGNGGVWLADRVGPAIMKFDPRTRKLTELAPLPGPAAALSFGGGYLWASIRTEDTIVRIDPSSGARVTISAGHRPAQAIAVGRRLFVASRDDHRVIVYDPRTTEPVGDALPVGLNPFALATDGRSIWATGLGGRLRHADRVPLTGHDGHSQPAARRSTSRSR